MDYLLHIKNTSFSNIIDKEKLFLFFVLLSLGSYTIDATKLSHCKTSSISCLLIIYLSYYNETHKLNDIKSSLSLK